MLAAEQPHPTPHSSPEQRSNVESSEGWSSVMRETDHSIGATDGDPQALYNLSNETNREMEITLSCQLLLVLTYLGLQRFS